MSAQNNSRSNNEATDSHVAGGYKATLSNEKSSDEAKRHAQEMLDKAGVDANERSNSGRSNNEATDNHIIGGYRATLSNEKSSEEAKAHAREMLEKAGVDADARPSLDNKLSQNEATDSHVIGGYRATLSNEKSSEEAKKHAREMLEKAGVNPDERASETGRFSNNEATDSHVIGGYRATLANENSSEDAKKHAREMLEKAGVNPDERADSTDDKRGLKRSTDDVKAEDNESGKGKQGFASMPKEKVQEIASKGGKTQNAGEEPSPKKSKSEEAEHKSNDSDKSDSGKGKQGFASMPKEKVQEIASKGGRTQNAGEEASEKSHGDSNKLEKSESRSESDKSDSGKGKQGFASMPKEKVQEIASKGGRTQNAGEGASEKSESKDSESRSESDKSDSGKGKQGFASMDKEKVKEIASKGGRTQQAGEPAAVKNQ